MPFWTLLGLMQGKQTAPWPLSEGSDGQEGYIGMPRYNPSLCTDECAACADVCPTRAITIRPSPENDDRLDVDYGRCVVCQLCTEACPTGAMAPSSDWAFGTTRREDLVWGAVPSKPSRAAASRARFRRSLHIRHVDAGSCNGCESELQALNNPFYNLHRLGIFFTASPRFADLLLVTGPVSYAMLNPLRVTYEAMPEPRWVMAVGTCAVSGGIAEGGYASGHGLEGVLPVDLYLPGCPPNPAAIIHALLMFLQRLPRRVEGGQLAR
jgi:Ni,Fe-hydrogenase III small subunit/formate hydrogenlyase subunit 6/NADH:ubiquinone oxidoreductase subunit I